VPDEDLYEQGVFPSTFNADHKWTFTVYMHISQRHQQQQQAKNLIAQLQGQAQQFKKAMLFEEGKATRQEAKTDAQRKLWEDRDFRTRAANIQGEANKIGATVGPVPSDPAKRPEWESASLESVQTEAGLQELDAKRKGAVKEITPLITKMVSAGADPATFEEGVKSALLLSSADQRDVEQNWPAYRGIVDMVASGAKVQLADIQSEIKARDEKMKDALIRLQHNQERLAIYARATTAREVDNAIQGIRLMNAELATDGIRATTMEYRAAGLLKMNEPEKAQPWVDGALELREQINVTEAAKQQVMNHLAVLQQTKSPAFIILQSAAKGLPVIQQKHDMADPFGWLAANAEHDDAKAFWDSAITDAYYRVSIQGIDDVEAFGAFVERMAIAGELDPAFTGMEDPLAGYAQPPAQPPEEPPKEQ
jgi:hypothetical protein